MHALAGFTNQKLMRISLLLLCITSLSACSLIYKLPTRQGNVLEQKQLDQLEVGMTPAQVEFLLGTPLAASMFAEERWDYVGYYKSPRGKETSRVVSLYFDQGRVSRMDGVAAEPADQVLEEPDTETLMEQDEKDQQNTEEPPPTGIVIQQEG